MDLQELVDLVRKIKYAEKLDMEIDRIQRTKEKIIEEEINHHGDFEESWDFYVPLAIAEKVADMMIEYYVNLKREAKEELAGLEVIRSVKR